MDSVYLEKCSTYSISTFSALTKIALSDANQHLRSAMTRW